MLLFGGFQRAGVWCEPVQKKESSLIPELTLRRIYICVVEYGCPVTGFGLDLSPRETARRKASVNKVVPRIVYSSLRLNASRTFLCTSLAHVSHNHHKMCSYIFVVDGLHGVSAS